MGPLAAVGAVAALGFGITGTIHSLVALGTDPRKLPAGLVLLLTIALWVFSIWLMGNAC